MKIDFDSTIFALFDEPSFIGGISLNLDSWPKILLFKTHHLLNSTTELILLLIHSLGSIVSTSTLPHVQSNVTQNQGPRYHCGIENSHLNSLSMF